VSTGTAGVPFLPACLPGTSVLQLPVLAAHAELQEN
jgi:hypothetical protein